MCGRFATQTIQEFRGNYTKFRELRAARDAQLQAAANRQSKEVARVQQFVDRFRYQANKARQVQSRIKQLEKVKLIELQRDTKRVKFKFPVALHQRASRLRSAGREQAVRGKSRLHFAGFLCGTGPANRARWGKRRGQEHAAQNVGRCPAARQRHENGRPRREPPLLCAASGRNAEPRAHDSRIAWQKCRARRKRIFCAA